MASGPSDTRDEDYAKRLVEIQQVWWKRLLDVQAPYRWNLQRLKPGFTLDVGCGIGRNLTNLRGNGIGIDHNQYAVAIARSRGFAAFTPDEFRSTEQAEPGTFDSLLLSHVVEHMNADAASELISSYIGFVRPGGKIIVETPQEAGYRSDSSHVQFVDFSGIRELLVRFDATIERETSFPFPRRFGSLFVYNEFVVSAHLPD